MSVSHQRRAELRRMTGRHIADAVLDDLHGERIMKEVWEACADDEEIMVVENEMKQIVSLLKARAGS